ncbi:MAG: hypothetical protein IJV22_09375 [Bacteroidales bacterium]|nr:hypothetical protein [Bacteroidales bacterium]
MKNHNQTTCKLLVVVAAVVLVGATLTALLLHPSCHTGVDSHAGSTLQTLILCFADLVACGAMLLVLRYPHLQAHNYTFARIGGRWRTFSVAELNDPEGQRYRSTGVSIVAITLLTSIVMFESMLPAAIVWTVCGLLIVLVVIVNARTEARLARQSNLFDNPARDSKHPQ